MTGPRPSCDCGVCKRCRQRAAVARYRAKHPDRIKANNQRNNPGRIQTTEKVREQKRVWAQAHPRGAFRRRRLTPEEKRAYQRRWAQEHSRDPIKAKARNLVTRAMTQGRLVPQPCEVCGIEPVDAHHDDYTKPLEVRWLCRRHHSEHHHD